jgi:hypothetical protein
MITLVYPLAFSPIGLIDLVFLSTIESELYLRTNIGATKIVTKGANMKIASVLTSIYASVIRSKVPMFSKAHAESHGIPELPSSQ